MKMTDSEKYHSNTGYLDLKKSKSSYNSICPPQPSLLFSSLLLFSNFFKFPLRNEQLVQQISHVSTEKANPTIVQAKIY